MPGRIRTLKPEWLDDERIAMLSSDARVLSIALILLADDYGNGRCHVLTVAPRVFPPPDESPESLARVSRRFRETFDELSRVDFCGLYSSNGQSYFAIRNWSKHQRIDRPSKPLVPSPPDGFWDTTRECLMQDSRVSRARLASDHDHDHDHDHELPGSQDERPATKANELVVQPIKKRKPRAKPIESEYPPTTEYRELVDCYFTAFEKRRGAKPGFGSREGKSAKAILASVGGDLARAKGIIENAYTPNAWASDKFTINDIARDPSKFIGAIGAVQQPPRWVPGRGNVTQPPLRIGADGKPYVTPRDIGLPDEL